MIETFSNGPRNSTRGKGLEQLHMFIDERDGGRRPPLVLKNFRANTSRSEILNDKKYIFNTVNSGQTLFSGQALVAQKS